jgi:hypothetical protein
VRNVRVTKGGIVILAVLAGALAVSLLTTGGVRFIAAGVVALIVLLLVGEGLSGPGAAMGSDTAAGSEAARKREVLSRGAKKRRFDDAP